MSTISETKMTSETTVETKDDPLGVGVTTMQLVILVGLCLCCVLFLGIGFVFVIMSAGSGKTSNMSSNQHYTVTLEYGKDMNPFNNLMLPPVIPRPPETFG